MVSISRRGFLRAARNVAIGGAIGALGLWRYAKFEAGWFHVSRHPVTLTGLPNGFNGTTLAHLSDLHFSSWITPVRFSEVVDIVLAQSPDLIAITGDFIDIRTDKSLIPQYIAQLSRLKARLGVFAVLGNHDYWEDAGLVRKMLTESGITELANRSARIDQQGESFYLCGLDDYRENKQDLDALLADFPEDERGILLLHEPDFADVSGATGRFSLQLSGHSHGGQVYIPLFGPPVTPMYAEKYPRGMYKVEEMLLYTSSGIGMVQPFVRFNCRPEVALFTLLSAQEGI